jgi:hypothetical protein
MILSKAKKIFLVTIFQPIFLFVVLINAPSAKASTYYISSTGTSSNNCTSTSDTCTFSRAQSLANSGDTLQIIGTISSITITKSGVIVDGGKVDGISNKLADSGSVIVQANNVTVRNIEIINGWSYGLRTAGGMGEGLVVENALIHDNVLENQESNIPGNPCMSNVSHGWGSAFRAYNTSNINVKNTKIYNNCGEGFSSLISSDVRGVNLEVYDNFSVNIYPDQAQNFTLTDSIISCVEPKYQRSGLSRSLLLGAESYSGVTTNISNNIIFQRNKIYNCKGVSTFVETTGNFQNVNITNNEFYNVPNPVINTISGSNIVLDPNFVSNNTSSPTVAPTIIPTIPTVAPTIIPTIPTVVPTLVPTVAPTFLPNVKPGDANDDDIVDDNDYLVWFANFTKAVLGFVYGDFNNNNIVDGVDYVIWLNNYGK